MKTRLSKTCDYGRLEDRRLLASFAFYPDNVQFRGFAENQVLSIFESGDSIVFYLPEGDIWNGTDLPGTIVGDGTSNLTVNPSLFVGKSLHITDDTETMDVVFASDLDLDLFLAADSVNQTAGTSLVLGGELFANAVVLQEPENHLDLTIHSNYVDLRSDHPIEIRDLVAGFGAIRSADKLSVGTYNTSFSRLQVSVTVTLEAPTIDIRSSRLGVTGVLNLLGRESVNLISQNINPGDGTGFGPFVGRSELSQLNFQSNGNVFISIFEDPGEFAFPDVGEVFLVGDNRARNLSLDVGFENILDVEQSTLQVTGNAFLSATGRIFLADHPSNLVHIGRRAHFEANSYFPEVAPGVPAGIEIFGNLFIAEAGDVQFGWLRSNLSTYITIYEDDSAYLARIGDADREGNKTATKLVDIHSEGEITIAPTGSIVSDSMIYLNSNGKIESATGSDQVVRAKLLSLRGTEISLDHLDVAQTNFQSAGDVRLQADSQLFLTGDNQAANISLMVYGLLGNTSGTTIQGDSFRSAAESIWLANATTTDQLLISGQAIFSAANGYAVVGDLGQVEVGLLNFNAFHAQISLTSNMYLFGNNVANVAMLSSDDYIADAAGAQIRVAGDALFTTPKGVYLADNANDFVSLCGHTVFDVGDFAFVNPPGTVEMNTWEVLNGAYELVVPDSNC